MKMVIRYRFLKKKGLEIWGRKTTKKHNLYICYDDLEILGVIEFSKEVLESGAVNFHIYCFQVNSNIGIRYDLFSMILRFFILGVSDDSFTLIVHSPNIQIERWLIVCEEFEKYEKNKLRKEIIEKDGAQETD